MHNEKVSKERSERTRSARSIEVKSEASSTDRAGTCVCGNETSLHFLPSFVRSLDSPTTWTMLHSYDDEYQQCEIPTMRRDGGEPLSISKC